MQKKYFIAYLLALSILNSTNPMMPLIPPDNRDKALCEDYCNCLDACCYPIDLACACCNKKELETGKTRRWKCCAFSTGAAILTIFGFATYAIVTK